MYYELNAKDIQQHSNSAVEFHSEFENFFRTSIRQAGGDDIITPRWCFWPCYFCFTSNETLVLYESCEEIAKLREK